MVRFSSSTSKLSNAENLAILKYFKMKYFFVYFVVLFCSQCTHSLPNDLFNEIKQIPLDQLIGGEELFLEDAPSKLRHERSARELEFNLDNDDDETNTSKEDTDNSNKESEDSILFKAICEPQYSNDKSINSTIDDDKKLNSENQLACLLLKKLIKNQSSPESEPKKKSSFSLSKYLPEDYNMYEVPRIKPMRHTNGSLYSVEGSPAECVVFINVRSIRDWDEDKGIVTLDMDIILLWSDGSFFKKYEGLNDTEKAKVSTKPLVLNPKFLKKLWLPDIYFEEVSSIKQPTFLGNSVTVVLHPTIGLLVYRSRAQVHLSCEIIFTYYPADIQECVFNLKSFSYVSKLLKLDWYGTGAYLHETSDPNFDYQISSISNYEMYLPLGPSSTDKSTTYTHLQFILKARRKMTYHLVQTYFASIFFVIVTWMCFMISPELFEVRVGIALSTLLTLTAMFSSIREQNPVVSYVKAIDIWMAGSVFFIFFALAGFITTAWIKRGLKRLQASAEDDEISLGILDRKKDQHLNEAEIKKKMHKYKIVYIVTEKFAVYILSVTYVIFNILYWTWLLTESNHLNWDVNSTLNKIDQED